MRVAGGSVDFVPPPQADKTATCNILKVVEVKTQQEEGEDEDEDEVADEEDAEEVHQEGA